MNIMELLPSSVLFKILKYVNHSDLISIGLAYPKLTQEILCPIFWKNINVHLDDYVFTKEQLRDLFNWYGSNIESISFNSSLLVGQENELNRFKCLKKLQLFNIQKEEIIYLICNSMTRLTDIKLEYLLLNNKHIDLIRISLKYLHSFCFGTKCIVNRGMSDLISSLRYVKKFGLKAPSISEE